MKTHTHILKILVGLMVLPVIAGADRIETEHEPNYIMDRRPPVTSSFLEELLDGPAQKIETQSDKGSAPMSKAEPKPTAGRVVIPIAGYSRAQVQGDNPPSCRKHPILKRRKTHAGCDMATGRGKAVLATMDGKVVSASHQRGYGNIITIRHKLPGGQVVFSRYAHLHKGKGCKMMSPGTTVKAGTKIGCVGNTGLSSGPHLHFEIRGSATGGAIYDSKHFVLSGGKLRKAKTC